MNYYSLNNRAPEWSIFYLPVLTFIVICAFLFLYIFDRNEVATIYYFTIISTSLCVVYLYSLKVTIVLSNLLTVDGCTHPFVARAWF